MTGFTSAYFGLVDAVAGDKAGLDFQQLYEESDEVRFILSNGTTELSVLVELVNLGFQKDNLHAFLAYLIVWFTLH